MSNRRQPTNLINVDFWADRIAALIKLAEHYGVTVEIVEGELVVSRPVSETFIARTEVRWRETPAGGAPQPKEAQPTVGYSGKGRLWCLNCPRPDGEDAPMTVDLVCVGELCPGCGRDVIDVARNLAEQTTKET